MKRQTGYVIRKNLKDRLDSVRASRIKHDNDITPFTHGEIARIAIHLLHDLEEKNMIKIVLKK